MVLSFNPTFDKSIHGLTESQGFVFSPNVKVSYDFTKKITGGFEYYGAVGPATDFDFGVGVGVTRSTDHLIAKMILGYRFNF